MYDINYIRHTDCLAIDTHRDIEEGTSVFIDRTTAARVVPHSVMKFSTWAAIVIAALSATVGAATMPLSEVPKCGVSQRSYDGPRSISRDSPVDRIEPKQITCALSIVGASECKSLANTACICKSQKLVIDLGNCVLSACTIPEALGML